MAQEYDKARLQEIAYQLRKGTVSDQEQAYFDKWYIHYKDDLLELPEDYAGNPLEIRDRMHDNLLAQIAGETKAKTSRLPGILWKSAAAVAILVCGLFFYMNRNQSGTAKPERPTAEADIAPGKHSATLTLANGKKIVLSDAGKGELAEEAEVSITKAADGQLVYEVKGGSQQGTANKINTLSTAKGETYRVCLPDGSKVWLNAASSLTYAFSLNERGERWVKLNGEAYFEIARDKAHPFVVITDRQKVEVLGTHFNVNSYQDEPVTETTLLKGSVRVSVAGIEKVLRPGQGAKLGAKGLVVAEANVALMTAWKDGQMAFKKTDIQSVLRQISRWYNVEVVYQGKVPDYTITGEVSRDESLSSILKVLALSEVNFELKGRKLVILP